MIVKPKRVKKIFFYTFFHKFFLPATKKIKISKGIKKSVIDFSRLKRYLQSGKNCRSGGFYAGS
jgi:hypothetical protein